MKLAESEQIMKRRDFIKRVEKLGYEVIEDRHEKANKKILKIMGYDILVAIIDEETRNAFNTMFSLYITEHLMKLIVEYSMTHIQDREDNRYHLRPRVKAVTESEREKLIELGFNPEDFELVK